MADGFEALDRALAGRYRLKAELGRGGMATVLLADDLRHDREVAVKVLGAALTRSVGVERFQREIRTTAGLNHPHILPLFDSGEAAGRLFYVMPMVEGDSLDDLLLREGTLSTPDAVELVSAVAEALQYAHDRGVVHRDVKPANILMHLGRPTIADFGISFVAGEQTRLTRDGLTVGSPDYMSPEQLTGEGDPGPETDQYALACVLYRMLEGEPPFRKATVQAVLAAHLVEEPPVLSNSVEGGGALSPVLGRAMAKDPADRFPSVADFARSLRNAVARAPVAIPSDRPGLVVLPFTNMSPDPDNEYFSDGLTEEVIADLTHIRALRVISRTSAMRFKGSDKDVGRIA
ncbi:MAG TPA: serine/threonine-protein kinase, partial [Longimicrobiales bacterium]|nr:serine/threonine-protein kinase [Longimicrobiales bacterium]